MAKGKYIPTANGHAPGSEKKTPLAARPARWRPPDTGARMGLSGMWAGDNTPNLAPLATSIKRGGEIELGEGVAQRAKRDISEAVHGTGVSHTDAMRSHTLDDVHYPSDRVGPGMPTAIPRTTPIDVESWEHGDGPAPTWASGGRVRATYDRGPKMGVLGGAHTPLALGPGTVSKPASGGGTPKPPSGGDSPTNIDLRTPEGRKRWADMGLDPKNIHVKPK